MPAVWRLPGKLSRSKLRIAARSWNGSHIHQPADAVCLQNADEFFDGMGGVPDGADRHGSVTYCLSEPRASRDLRELCKVMNASHRKFLLYGPFSPQIYLKVTSSLSHAVRWEFVKTTESVCLRRRAHRPEHLHQPSRVRAYLNGNQCLA